MIALRFRFWRVTSSDVVINHLAEDGLDFFDDDFLGFWGKAVPDGSRFDHGFVAESGG
jgi:hypothetical protein